MLISAAKDKDLPDIIKLIRSSLGESLIPKSESLWKWKHEMNPFGNSFVLIAKEQEEIIGVRAFMQWQWVWQNKTYKAIRAVDTATHPNHQGKGIFKKLTLNLLEHCKNEGIDFVFNTPNEQSRPGYLKMGWQQQGKMPLKIKLVNPFQIIKMKLKSNGIHKEYSDPTPPVNWTHAFDFLPGFLIKQPVQIHTPFSSDYFKWRYSTNPLFNYTYFTDNANYFATARIKLQNDIRELRITDFVRGDLNKNAAKDFKEKVRQYCKQHQIHFISVSGNHYQFHKSYFNWMGMIPVKPLGPIVTLRNLNVFDFDKLMQTDNWCYTLGDLELF